MEITESKLDFADHLDFGAILTNPILDIAARVWEPERYEAFKTCYRSMRLIDDLVDGRKSSGGPISDAEIAEMSRRMEQWLQSVRNRKAEDPYTEQFLVTLDRFALPLWPWERLCKSMIYDLRNDGFATFPVFLRYCEGAAISPAAIFMHLCGVRRENEKYLPPVYDIRKAARLLAIFSYLTHILRDFQKDQRSQLNYFADAIIAKSGTNRKELEEIAHSGIPSDDFKALMRDYVAKGEYYRTRARRSVEETLPLLEPRYQLSLELIYGLYNQIFSRVDPERADFSPKALHPSEAELEQEIRRLVEQFRPVRR
jgi:phytoene/squalene synthetase